MADPKQSRGYRNRNPGNIDYNPANKWQGQVGKENGGRFCVFKSHEFGIRALAMLLTTYYDRYGLRTVEDIINKWAPPVENNSRAYINAVSGAIGRSPTAQLDLHSYVDMEPLVKAIIRHELGGMPYTQTTIDAGLQLAGIAPAKVFSSQMGFAALTTSGAAVAGTVIDQVLTQYTQNSDAINGVGAVLTPVAPWLPAALAAVTAVFNLILRFRRTQEIAS